MLIRCSEARICSPLIPFQGIDEGNRWWTLCDAGLKGSCISLWIKHVHKWFGSFAIAIFQLLLSRSAAVSRLQGGQIGCHGQAPRSPDRVPKRQRIRVWWWISMEVTVTYSDRSVWQSLCHGIHNRVAIEENNRGGFLFQPSPTIITALWNSSPRRRRQRTHRTLQSLLTPDSLTIIIYSQIRSRITVVCAEVCLLQILHSVAYSILVLVQTS